jgi:hypothetical protein
MRAAHYKDAVVLKAVVLKNAMRLKDTFASWRVAR